MADLIPYSPLLDKALTDAETALAAMHAESADIVARGAVADHHKDVHPWIEYDLPCDQYAQMLVRFDLFQLCQAHLRALLAVYTSLPFWRKPPLVSFGVWIGRNPVTSDFTLEDQRERLAEQAEQYDLGPREYVDMVAVAEWGAQRAALYRRWHDAVAGLVDMAFWATNIQPLFMFPGEAQRGPSDVGWFSSGLGVPDPVRALLVEECTRRGGVFSFWQDDPSLLAEKGATHAHKQVYYASFHHQLNSWFPGHPAAAAVFAPMRRGVNVLKKVRGDKDGMVWEAQHWDELDRYQNLTHRAFPVDSYEAWAGPECLRPGKIPEWIGVYPEVLLDWVRVRFQGQPPIPFEDDDHPANQEGKTVYTPGLAGGKARRARRRRRFRRFLHWVFSPGTAMAQTIVEHREQDEPQRSIMRTIDVIDTLTDEQLEDFYWAAAAADNEILDAEWLEAWEDPRKYHLGAKLRDRQQDIRRQDAIRPVTTMGPAMRLKWARAWAQGVAYQDAAQTFRDAMNLYFDGHIKFWEARGELHLDASAREAMAVAKAQANGQRVTSAIGAVAGIAAAINPIVGAIVAVVAALVGLFTSLFGGNIRADNFRLAPQTPVLRQPADPAACAPPEAADAVADLAAQTPSTSSFNALPLALGFAGILAAAVFLKKK